MISVSLIPRELFVFKTLLTFLLLLSLDLSPVQVQGLKQISATSGRIIRPKIVFLESLAFWLHAYMLSSSQTSLKVGRLNHKK